MTAYLGEPDYVHGSEERLGVLITNLGTPDAPTPAALRRYLGEFLWDPRVVELPRPLWWLILHGIILRTRPARSARAYAKVWGEEGSPLLAISRRQEAVLRERLAQRLPGPVQVALGMRYGSPSIRDGLHALRRAGVRRLLVLPLYPQYSASTTASTFDAVAEELKRWRWMPELRFVTGYAGEDGYIDALAASVRSAWETNGKGERLLMSFHGLPKRFLLAGDPYHCQCHKTGRLLAARLGLADDAWAVTFQSRFGRAEWLKPYTDHTLKVWGKAGLGSVDVICPGFSADCLETLEEMGMQNREVFVAAGGGEYRYIHALNDNADHIDCLADLAARHLQGWPEAAADYDAEAIAGVRSASRERALAMGAAR
jgi:ferrochelatase